MRNQSFNRLLRAYLSKSRMEQLNTETVLIFDDVSVQCWACGSLAKLKLDQKFISPKPMSRLPRFCSKMARNRRAPEEQPA